MKSRIIWSNYDHNQQSKSTIKNSRLHPLHVTKINDLHCMHFTSFHVAHHFMLYFMSFHVVFHIISHCISYISLYTSHASHVHHTCRAFRIARTACISCIAPHITSFYVSFHVILSWKFIAYSFIPFRSEERRKQVKTAHSSIERLPSEVF